MNNNKRSLTRFFFLLVSWKTTGPISAQFFLSISLSQDFICFLKNNRNAYSSVRIWKLFNFKCEIFLRRSGYPTLYTYYLHHNKLIYINGKCRLNLLSSIQLKRMIGRIETGKAWSVVFSFLEFCYASNCKEKVAKQVEHNAFSLLHFIGST